jgi:dihydroneopterin aldolase
MLTIKLKNLKLKTIIGVYSWEQDIQRDLIVNTTIEAEEIKTINDELINTIDYEELTNLIKSIVRDNRFKLVESLVDKIINEIKNKYKNIYSILVEIDKLGALADLESFCVAKKLIIGFKK